VCLFALLRISPLQIKLAASSFAWWFINVPGRESPISVNFAPPPAEAKNRTNRPAQPCCNVMLLGLCDSHAYQVCMACGRRISICEYIRPSPKTDILVSRFFRTFQTNGHLVHNFCAIVLMERQADTKKWDDIVITATVTAVIIIISTTAKFVHYAAVRIWQATVTAHYTHSASPPDLACLSTELEFFAASSLFSLSNSWS